jgi:putative membrane protein
MKTRNLKDKYFVPLIWGLSILVPFAVAILLYMPKIRVNGFNVKILPTLNAGINFTVSILLILGVYFIKQKNIKLHKVCMLSAFVLSSIFLISYVIYHASVPETRFGGQGIVRYIYFFVLITHIILATLVVPLALFSIYRGLNSEVVLHKKIVKYTFPIWLYVSVTGVIVYLMISPYYT